MVAWDYWVYNFLIPRASVHVPEIQWWAEKVRKKKIIVQIYGVHIFLSPSPSWLYISVSPFFPKGRFSQRFLFFSQQISWLALTHTLSPSSAQTHWFFQSEMSPFVGISFWLIKNFRKNAVLFMSRSFVIVYFKYQHPRTIA